MLGNCVYPQLVQFQQNLVSKQDGATSHRKLIIVRDSLDATFHERWIGRGGST